MMRTFEGILRRSPVGNVRILLSSRTEFKFSAHSGSTSPSHTIQCRRLWPRGLYNTFRNILVNTPSVHSRGWGDRKSEVSVKRVSVRVYLGGRVITKKKKHQNT